MYTVAITPILVGSLAAHAETGFLSLRTLCHFLLSAVLIIAWLNITNDVFDYDAGIDGNKPESIVNLCGATRTARNTLFLIANVILAAGFACLAKLSKTGGQFDPTVPALISVAVAGGYVYQGPPFRLSHYGLGEPICFVTWTISLSARMRYVLQELLFSSHHYLLAAAFLVATPTALILLCSHFHQLDDDKLAGKRSPIVRLGTLRASILLEAALFAFMSAHSVFYGMGMLPVRPFFLSLLAIPSGVKLGAFVRKNHQTPHAVRPAKYHAVRFHFVHGILISIGFWLTTPAAPKRIKQCYQHFLV
ncbi:unnamed protein product [Chondrus crispus]|uniref:1,4-dihydroxy-2-naphthoate octaprenyltransferase n=1 Tax=Chondrus crispus TaxID=2769 RepID=R7QBF8_CHOCR|nr:unnamed protein product [Chondrus crispus]CDF35103.1 unnamed protein product [Chondrus crispus]|eukprot:XP_005714922.1 unnamed protein product [Chondrus crispus]